MKKYFLIALALIASLGIANAQYKPEGSKLSTEINYLPGKDGEISMPDYGLKVRYDLNDRWTARLSMGYEHASSTDKTFEDAGNDSSFDVSKESNNTFSIVPGIEYKFRSHGRVFPYAGAQLGYYGGRRTSMPDRDNKVAQPINALVIGAFTGVDVFLCEALYLGVELGLDYEYLSLGRTKSSNYADGTWNINHGHSSESTNAFGFSVVPALRIGWYF